MDKFKRYKHHFLNEWRAVKKAFIRPKFWWYFGTWRNEPNLPVWRRGPQIHWGKPNEVNETWSYALLTDSEWNETGKINHPILSKIIKHPTWQLPIWLSFHFFNNDLMYKTKWADDDFRYEFPPHITLVFFGLAISVTARIDIKENGHYVEDDYWESLLTYKYYGGDLRKTNEALGYYSKPNSDDFRFCFSPKFLKNIVDQDDLIDIQEKVIHSLKNKNVWIIEILEQSEDASKHDGYVAEYQKKLLVYKTKEDCDRALNNLKSTYRTKNGVKMSLFFTSFPLYIHEIDKFKKMNLPKSALKDNNYNMFNGLKDLDDE